MNTSFEFEKEKFVGEGFTYDDVLLLPAYSEILPVKLIYLLISKEITLNIPIVSALWIPLRNQS